jgi:hypothetical protein
MIGGKAKVVTDASKSTSKHRGDINSKNDGLDELLGDSSVSRQPSSQNVSSSANNTPNQIKKGTKEPPKSLYERLIGKSSVVNEPKKQPMKNAIVGWFAKETAEERAIRITLKNYKTKLITELQQVTRAIQRHKRRVVEQAIDFDKQEKQLIAWGLKGAIPKFHMQVRNFKQLHTTFLY